MWFEALHPDWQVALSAWEKPLGALERELGKQAGQSVPPFHAVMRVFETPPEGVRVLLLGQDPYPAPGVATGLAFACAATHALPQSLQNLSRELESDLGHPLADRTLGPWQTQGVFLLNAALTTVAGRSGAHEKLWRPFTSAVLAVLDAQPTPPVSLLLGGWAARRASSMLRSSKVSVAHPSPLSAHRGFFGSRPFSRVNVALRELGRQEIDW